LLLHKRSGIGRKKKKYKQASEKFLRKKVCFLDWNELSLRRLKNQEFDFEIMKRHLKHIPDELILRLSGVAIISFCFF
jgi:hypothetical protein